jgi:hypothetical protein
MASTSSILSASDTNPSFEVCWPIELQAEPAEYTSKFLFRDFLVSFEHPNARFVFFDKLSKQPNLPFSKIDINQAKKSKEHFGYSQNTIFPFEPEEAASAGKWILKQGILHGYKKGSITWDKTLCEWKFPLCVPQVFPFYGNAMNNNQCGDLIICCEKAEAQDDNKNFSLYHAILNDFAKNLIGKLPVDIIKLIRVNYPEDVYSQYRYFFNTVTYFEDEAEGQIKPILRRFACNELDGNNVDELSFGEHPPMVFQTESDFNRIEEGKFVWDDKEFLVRLPGVPPKIFPHVHLLGEISSTTEVCSACDCGGR